MRTHLQQWTLTIAFDMNYSDVWLDNSVISWHTNYPEIDSWNVKSSHLLLFNKAAYMQILHQITEIANIKISYEFFAVLY